ncbi:PREDICTED: pyrroline-5-carboxylate reductase-like [Brassica oleracea var. oleracea]|uniref:pyrroline-5-carboxylate reductase-like n=1 Tax=Brassica oleracea var. oleracea TaxID=109376 RepID=UPI0006A73FB7|nr:PREDICTED: pyrroline-5-carboxylate reductase-like [Brassica oleracea var. oleracea]
METLPISAESFKVGFIGAGKMAESIARGVVASGMLPPNRNSTAVHSNLNRRQVFESFGVNVFSSSEEVVKESDVVIFYVKPQEWSGQDRFVRVMPNTPAAVGETVVSPSPCFNEPWTTEEDGALVAKLFGSVGKMFKADEKMFDAVTCLSGSGPAYIFLAIEALADGGVAAGLPRELALGLASQTVLGGATMVSKTGKYPGVLKDDVTSPGRTTRAGVHELEKGSWSCNNGEQNG